MCYLSFFFTSFINADLNHLITKIELFPKTGNMTSSFGSKPDVISLKGKCRCNRHVYEVE